MYIASVSTNIKFHDFPNGNVVQNYQPGKVEGPVKSVSWSKDGNWLVVVPHKGLTEIVSTKDQFKLLKTIREIEEPTAACFQNSTKKMIGIGTKCGLILIYDIKSRHVKKRFSRASSDVTHVSFTAKDTHLVAACKTGDVLVYNNVTNSLPAYLRVPNSKSVSSLKTNQLKRNLVLGGSNEGIVVVWDINISRSKFHAEAHKAPVNSVAFSPVNSDLILTAGADRQFCFYDIADNKCIANISVENSITAVDFSPDGTNFALASQNGRVAVYDSRNIHVPIHSFSAHKSTIRYLAFQNSQDESSSYSSLRSTENFSPLHSENRDKRRSQSIRTSDLFDVHLPTTDGVFDRQSVVSVEAEDSFIAALGLNKSTTGESVNNDDSVFTKDIKSRLSSINEAASPYFESFQINKAEAGEFTAKQCSSTPKFQIKPEPASPNILPTSDNNIISNDIKSLVKECLNEQFKGILNDLKNDITYQATHYTVQLRGMLLDIQMGMVRGFIKLEDTFNNIRQESSLEAENKRLRSFINLLVKH